MACLKLRLTRIVLPLFLAFIQYARAATDPETNPWRTYSGFAPAASSEAWVQPDSFLAFEVDHSVLENILKRAGKESAGGLAVTDAVITLPGPDGTFTRFRFLESS